MITVYDLRDDSEEIERVQAIIKDGPTRYRTRWGLFGTDDWFEKLRSEGLISELNGEISRVYMSGHNDFPEFEIVCDGETYSFPRIGDDEHYVIGGKVIIECLANENLFASDITQGGLHILSLRVRQS